MIWDHPRSRGEYSTTNRSKSLRIGSSPLSRGIPVPGQRDCGGVRIIPALAGNTSPARSFAAPTWGSSPLSRGIQPMRGFVPPKPRIIPALAGNTTIPQPECPNRGDHPRSRGEYEGVVVKGDHYWGSSPLSRGIPARHLPCRLYGGIIPALAGNTRQALRGGLDRTDHPRSRGEYTC